MARRNGPFDLAVVGAGIVGLACANAAARAGKRVVVLDRDACANMFDAMEAIAKVKLNMPSATFGNCLSVARERSIFLPQVIDVLGGLNEVRNKRFGHGMTEPFSLSPAEVDFAYLTCVAGVILFARR